MQIGIRAHDCAKAPFEDLVKDINRQGFLCTQLALGKAIYEFPVDRGAMTPGMALYIKHILERNNVDVAVLGCYLNLGTPDSVELAETTEIYKAHIRFASLLGCGVVGTETGAINTTYSYEIGNSSDEALETFIKNVRPIVEYAEKLGVIFALESVHSHIVCNLKRMRKVLDAINSPNLQVIFDPVNVFTPENYMKQDEIMEEAFNILGKDIAVIHSKDFKIEDGKLISTQPGTGLFHYDVLMKFIKEHKPHIHVLLEDTVPENAIAAKEYVLNKYNEA